jgi:hypothetical protein
MEQRYPAVLEALQRASVTGVARRYGVVPPEGGRTRLITRLRHRYAWEAPVSAILALFLVEFGDFPMMRRALKGIKVRAGALERKGG